MRIIDETSKQALTSVLIMLTPSEVQELIDSLESLHVNNDHVHMDDDLFKRKITIGIYTKGNLEKFHPEVRRIIDSD